METYALLMAGGKDGRVLVPGHPEKSILLDRVRLPDDDDDFMPSDGKHPFSAREIGLLESWIAAGARP